ncbi:MAG: DUF4230 domain-containing protein [Erysipelotrichaceae bacterium]|nr:DUF4230 domain-containing protein [Erysipelotrichaceae bacterium]
MAEEVKVKAKAKTVKNDKTDKQSEELAKAKQKKEEAKVKAQKASEDRIKEERLKKEKAEKLKQEEEKRIKEAEALEKEKKDKTKETISGVAAIATTALAGKKNKGFFSGLIIGLVAGIALSFMLSGYLDTMFKNPIETVKDNFDEVLTETFAGYTAVDFKNAVLGEASQHQELIVMEQPLVIDTTITKAGLGNLAIFSKTKEISYAGTGVYTVDLKDIDEDHIRVDEEEKTVTIYINHTVLQYVNISYDEMKFEDTEKGLLSFGDITLTMEQQNELEKSVQSSMRETLLQETLLNQADEFAKMKCWEVFQPLISAVSPEFVVEIEFNK